MKKHETWKERHYDRESLLKRLFKNRVIDPVTGCWIAKSVLTTGYGVIRFEHHGHKSAMRLHRLVAWLYLGYDGNLKVEVCHHCNVKACFNPAHLYLASHRQNMLDARRDKLWKKPSGRRSIKPHPGTETIQ